MHARTILRIVAHYIMIVSLFGFTWASFVPAIMYPADNILLRVTVVMPA